MEQAAFTLFMVGMHRRIIFIIFNFVGWGIDPTEQPTMYIARNSSPVTRCIAPTCAPIPLLVFPYSAPLNGRQLGDGE